MWALLPSICTAALQADLDIGCVVFTRVQINGVSEQFIAINNTLTKAETAVTKMEKDRA